MWRNWITATTAVIAKTTNVAMLAAALQNSNDMMHPFKSTYGAFRHRVLPNVPKTDPP